MNVLEKREYHREYMKEYRADGKVPKEDKAHWDRIYRERHKDSISARLKEKYRENPEPAKIRARKYYHENPEKVKAYREATKEHRADKKKQWDEKNAVHRKEYRKKIYEENAEAYREYGRQYHRDNRENRLIYLKKWKANNPDKLKAQYQRKHIKRRARIGTIIERINYDAIYERDKGLCQLCGDPVVREKMTLDHIIPLAKGGIHSQSNVQLAHRGCNSKKGTKSMEEFFKIAV